MMAEQVQPRPHRRQHLVDRRLARIVPRSARGVVDTRTGAALRASAACRRRCSALARLDFSRTKCRRRSASSVAFAVPFFGCGSSGRRVRTGRRKRAAKAGDAQTTDVVSRAVRDVVEVGGQVAGRDAIEVLVVALDPVQGRGDRLVAARRRRRHRRRKARTGPRDAAP